MTTSEIMVSSVFVSWCMLCCRALVLLATNVCLYPALRGLERTQARNGWSTVGCPGTTDDFHVRYDGVCCRGAAAVAVVRWEGTLSFWSIDR